MNLRALAIAGVTLVAVIAVGGGVVLWNTVTAPLDGGPCPTTTRAAIEARGEAFDPSFFTSQYTNEGKIVRAVLGEPYPDCWGFLGAMRCTAEGPTTVGARSLDEEVYFDFPAGARATIAIWSGPGIICGMEAG